VVDLLLILTIAGERVAFPADEVESVIELDEIVPVPGSAGHIAGLASLRSRVLTVVDCRAALDCPAGARTEAVVVPSGGHYYALLVDGVEDVVDASGPIEEANLPFGSVWARAALGTVEAGGDLLLLVDPHALVAGAPSRTTA
jgi:purine-binding chemotaxis protein CheW